MPQFSPGESKTAIAPITAKPAGTDCEAELFLGPNEATKVATSGRIPFISTGVAQNVRLPIKMPAEGTYHGYIDVASGGLRFLAYKTIEDVVIAPVAAKFAYVSDIRAEFPRPVWGPARPMISIDVQNQGGQAGICGLELYARVMYQGEGSYGSWQSYQRPYHYQGQLMPHLPVEKTITPGETVTFTIEAVFGIDPGAEWSQFKQYEVKFVSYPRADPGELRKRII